MSDFRVQGDVVINKKPIKDLKRDLENLSQPLGRITGDAAEFNKSLQAAAARVTAFGAIAGVIAGIGKSISGAAKATIEVNKELTELNSFLGQSRQSLGNFGKELFSIARQTATDFKIVSEAAKEFARQGLSTEETLKRTSDALILSRISGLDFAQSVTSITTAINTFNKVALNSTEIVNKLIAVDTKFAVSAEDLAQALSRVGSSAEESGLSIDQLLATITATQQITGRGGSVIGNSLKTIFTRIRRPEVLEQLQSIGVVVRDQNGALLDGISILENYSKATRNLSQVEKARTAELLGGVFQINQLQAIIRDLSSANSIYERSLKTSINATNEAIQKNSQLNQSYSALFSRTLTNAKQVGAQLGEDLFSPLFVKGSATINGILNFISGGTLNDGFANAGQQAGESFGRTLVKSIGDAIANFAIPAAATLGSLLTLRLGGFGFRAIRSGISGSLSGGLAGRAEGYVPAFAREESRARSMGAINPKAGIINANINGKKGPVIVNNQERIFNVGGQTAIVPNYRNINQLPSFAAGTGGKPDLSELDEQLARSAQKITNLAITGGILAPLINTGTQFAARRGIISPEQSDVGNIVGGLSLTALLGNAARLGTPKGASRGQLLTNVLAATAAPAISTIGSFLGRGELGEELEVGKLQAQLDKIADESNKNVGKLQDLNETLTKLDSAYNDPNASPEDIKNLSRKAADALRGISLSSPQTAARLAAAQSPQETLNISEQILREDTTRRELKTNILNFASIREGERTVENFGNLFRSFSNSINSEDIEKLKKVAGKEGFSNLLSEISLSEVSDFFESQGENSKKLKDVYKKFLEDTLEIEKLRDQLTEDLGEAQRPFRSRSEDLKSLIRVSSARTGAFTEGFKSLGSNVSALGGGELSSLSFAAKLKTTSAEIQQGQGFLSQIIASDINDSLKSLLSSTPSEGNIQILTNAIEGASEDQKDSLRELLQSNESGLREITEQKNIAQATLEVQKSISNQIAQAGTFGGGIQTSLSASDRNKNLQELLRPALKAQFGARFGDRRTFTAGRAEFLGNLARQFPGSGIESSLESATARRELASVRQRDLLNILGQASNVASSIGLGGATLGAANVLRGRGGLNLAFAQAEQALPTGRTPLTALNILQQGVAASGEGLRERRVLDAQILELGERSKEARRSILEDIEPDLKNLSSRIQDALNSGLQNIKIDRTTIDVTGDVIINSSKKVNASKGFIPSFANPLREAIARENQFVPSSTIRVNQSNKLVNRMNPMGLAVTNTIDEPNGLASIGLASGGFIPNFAVREFSVEEQLKAFGKSQKGELFVQNAQSGDIHRIMRNGNFTKKPVPFNSIPRNAQIITIKNPKTFNQLKGGFSIDGRMKYPIDRNLSRLGDALRKGGLDSFDRRMVGRSPAALAFNLAEGRPDYRPMVDFGRRPVGTVRNVPGYFQGLQDEKRAILRRQLSSRQSIPILPGTNLEESIEIGKAREEARRQLLEEEQQRKRSYDNAKKYLSRQSRPSLASRFKGVTQDLSNRARNVLTQNMNLRGLSIIDKIFEKISSVTRLNRVMQSQLAQRLLGSSIGKFATGGLRALGPLGVAYQNYKTLDNITYKEGGFSDFDLTTELALAGSALLFSGPQGLASQSLGRGTFAATTYVGEKTGLSEPISNLLMPFLDAIEGPDGDILTTNLQSTLTKKRLEKIGQADRRKPLIRSGLRGIGNRPGIVRSKESFALRGIREFFRDVPSDLRDGIMQKAVLLESSGYNLKELLRNYKLRYNTGGEMLGLVRRSEDFVPNFAGGFNSEAMDIATSPDYSGFRTAKPQMSRYYSNVITNSAEIEVPATEVYNRMGFFGARPKNSAEQYAILNPAQQKALGYASNGFIPNFAAEEFVAMMTSVMEKAFSPLVEKMGDLGSSSNIINVNDQRSYKTDSERINGVIEFLTEQFPKEMGKFGLMKR